MDAFARDLGTKQGRIAPSGVAPLVDDYVFCLGFDDAGHFELFEDGDNVSVEQAAEFTAGTRLFRASARIRPPVAELEDGLGWILQLRIDGTTYAQHILVPGGATRTRTLSANVSKLAPGVHTVQLRLILTAVP